MDQWIDGSMDQWTDAARCGVDRSSRCFIAGLAPLVAK
jgi:hypothetical protein